MKNIYLAGPFFSDEQIDRVSKVESALRENPTVNQFFSPRLSDENDDNINDGSPQWAKGVFNHEFHIQKPIFLVVFAVQLIHS